MEKKFLKRLSIILLILLVLTETACGNDTVDRFDEWEKDASLDSTFSEGELYEAALNEGVLVVYTVSTRVTKVKDAFEKKYPGLSVEVRDLRSPDLIEAVVNNYKEDCRDCDVVICNDNSGAMKKSLVDTGIVVKYVPSDVASKIKPENNAETLTFLDEAELLFYNGAKYKECPITNIWELTEEQYKGTIFIPSPLRSFSTYAFCGSSLECSDAFKDAYREYYGKEYEAVNGANAAEGFWNAVIENVVFTNSSDEVTEALLDENSAADFGIMVSSKYRMAEVGYSMQPVYNLTPFSGCLSSFSVMMAKGAQNVNTAKLFIHFLLGEEDGKGEGYKPFVTVGTWPARSDVESRNAVNFEDADIIYPNEEYLLVNEDYIRSFFEGLIQK